MIDREYVEESDRLMGMDSAMPPVKAGADAGDDDPHEFAGALEGNDPIVLAANDGVSARTKQGFKEAGLDADGGYGGSSSKQGSDIPKPAYENVNKNPKYIDDHETRKRIESARKLGLPPTATDDEIRRAAMKKMR